MEYASNEIWNMEHEHEKGNTGHSPYMKSGIWNHEVYPILEYGNSENMKLGTWNKVIWKFEPGNLHHPLGSPKIVKYEWAPADLGVLLFTIIKNCKCLHQ